MSQTLTYSQRSILGPRNGPHSFVIYSRAECQEDRSVKRLTMTPHNSHNVHLDAIISYMSHMPSLHIPTPVYILANLLIWLTCAPPIILVFHLDEKPYNTISLVTTLDHTLVYLYTNRTQRRICPSHESTSTQNSPLYPL